MYKYDSKMITYRNKVLSFTPSEVKNELKDYQIKKTENGFAATKLLEEQLYSNEQDTIFFNYTIYKGNTLYVNADGTMYTNSDKCSYDLTNEKY